MSLTTMHTSHSLFPPFPSLKSLATRTTVFPSPSPSSSHRRLNLRRRRSHNFNVVVRSCFSMPHNGRFLEGEEAEMLLATCITRNLPPALTLEQGLDKVWDAVQLLKSNPPRSDIGMYRLQVAVSPGAKAFKWFCRQAASSGVFPQFFVSTEVEKPSSKTLSLSTTRGVFGIGAAVCFKGSYSCASTEKIPFQRCHSTVLTAYSLSNSIFLATSSSMKYENSSFCTFIPQIELVELEGLSFLAATLAWSNSSLHAFEEAIQNHEFSMYQATHSLWPMEDNHSNICISASLRKFNTVEDKNAEMVCINALSMGRRDVLLEHIEMVSSFSCKMLFAPINSPSDFHLL